MRFFVYNFKDFPVQPEPFNPTKINFRPSKMALKNEIS